jgi:uncharacterized protein YxjI
MLGGRQFLVKERVAVLKLTDVFDIYDPTSGAKLGTAREVVSGGMKLLRLVVNKRLLPNTIEVREGDQGPVALTLRKGVALLHASVAVSDRSGRLLGTLRSKVFSIGGAFHLLDPNGQPAGEIKGDWKGWNFVLRRPDGREVGRVTKKWAGVGKELFTSADNYMVALDDGVKADPALAGLLLAAGLAIDIVYKEK